MKTIVALLLALACSACRRHAERECPPNTRTLHMSNGDTAKTVCLTPVMQDSAP